MPDNTPTAEQIRGYLLANGWQMGDSGSAAYLMVTQGHTVRMLHNPTEYDLGKAVFDIALAENRHPADVRASILSYVAAAGAGTQPATAPRPRLFRLQRDVDSTGVSGPGHVADGVVWADGTVTLRWFGAHASTVCWAGIGDAVAVHGHDGATRFVYDDLGVPQSDYPSVWAELTGWVQAAEEDGEMIDPADLLAYLRELKGRAQEPIRDWMRAISGDPA